MQFSLERVASSRACSSVSSRSQTTGRCSTLLCVPRWQPAGHASCSTHAGGQFPHRQQVAVVTAAYAPSLPPSATMSSGGRSSLDPMAAAWEQAWEPGRLLTIKSPEQFAAVSAEHPEKLFVLMCKSHSCRPCKMFTRKYLSIVSHRDVFAGQWVCTFACSGRCNLCCCVSLQTACNPTLQQGMCTPCFATADV
jgi:hypothetical protein